MHNSDYFLKLIKNDNYELYICSLFQKDKYIDRLFAIISIFHEINYITYKIKEKIVGYIRLAWWRESLEKLCNHDSNKHPLIIQLNRLSTEELKYFKEIIDAVEIEIEDIKKYQDNYANKKYSSLFKLISINLNQKLPEDEILDNMSYNFFIIKEIIFKPTNKANLDIKNALNKFELNLPRSKLNGNIFLQLIFAYIKFYISKLRKLNYNISKFLEKNYKFQLVTLLYFSYISILIRN